MHHGQRTLHRVVGLSSLLLFPLLIGGLVAIIDVTAKAYVTGDKPLQATLGGSFLIGLAIAVAAYVTLYFRALAYRAQVWRHSGYMLTTPLILFESPFGGMVAFGQASKLQWQGGGSRHHRSAVVGNSVGNPRRKG